MKPLVNVWRDPTFYIFLLFGVVLLCSGLLCRKQAERVTEPGETVGIHATVTTDPGVLLSSYVRARLTPKP